MSQQEETLKSSSFTMLDKYLTAKIVGISPHTVKTYRERYWQAGIHYVRCNSRMIRYNQELIIDWVANRSNSPECHQRAIEAYLASLLSNKPKTRGRKPK
ncbi:hypothetical protein QH73_0006460 [Scytonema millei VB511283]|uniref:Uncharacterized protein n=2 Tax=Scytonema TaxID=1203 RepID=A0A9X5I3B4_9CYAN|nr:hypothetical protein [Scytonema millei VB511283]